MKRLVLNLLPDALAQKFRQSNYRAHRTAAHLASTSKRIDICAAQLAHVFYLSKHPSLEGKICLEIGSGWVLSHALVCYLLGAKKVFATDVVRCARPEVISSAVRNAIGYIPQDILAPFSDHSSVRERFDRLLSIPQFSFGILRELGIDYRSPVDFAVEKVNTAVDFVYSTSVLEHVPKPDVLGLLNNLAESLNPGGTMIHCIHLEDHEDIDRHPFEFLSIPENRYPRELQSARGNRITCSGWRGIFGQLEGTNTEFIYRYSRLDQALPGLIDPSIAYQDEQDLRTSHVGAYTRKEA